MELVAQRMVAGGDALARADDGRVVLIDGALPDERVRVTITADRADHLRARVVDVLEPAPARVTPPCVYARAGCGGCGWQHIDLDAQRAYKIDVIRDALRRIAHVDNAPVRAMIELAPDGYRTTVRALVVNGRAAFRRHHSHDPIAIDDCLVAHPLVDDVLERGRFRDATEVVVRAGASTGERCAYATPTRAQLAVPDDVHVGPHATIHEEIDGVRLRVNARAFFQTRADGATALARLVRAAVGPHRRVADLYCGVGLFAAILDRPERVVAVERDRIAANDARHNLHDLSAQIAVTDVDRWRPRRVDVVVADPSRRGLGHDGARVVLGCRPERIVLVSCDVAACARDIALLCAGGYKARSITPVDLFPHTPHIECVSVLDL